MRRVPSKNRNAVIVRERDRNALKRLSLLLLCAFLLAGGFVYAGVQHFAALRLGYETEKLRNALTDAREEQRRLTVQREVVASPARLEQAARQLGMQPMQPSQLDSLRQTAQLRAAKTSVDIKPASKTAPKQKPQQLHGKK